MHKRGTLNKAEKPGTDCRAVACPEGWHWGPFLLKSDKSQFTAYNIRPCPVMLQAGGEGAWSRCPCARC